MTLRTVIQMMEIMTFLSRYAIQDQDVKFRNDAMIRDLNGTSAVRSKNPPTQKKAVANRMSA